MKNEKELNSGKPPVEAKTKEIAKINPLEEKISPSEEYIRDCEIKALNFINPKLWQSMKAMSDVFITSGALPNTIKNAAQLMLVLQAGYEAGLQPVDSINSMYIVNGKVVMYGDTVISQVHKAGHKIIWGECTDEKAEVTIERGDNGEKLSGTATIAEARKAGVVDKSQAWQKYPKRMLKYKAFAETAHFIVPDALKGIGIAEEFEGVEEEKAAGVIIKKAGEKSLTEALENVDSKKVEEAPEAQVEKEAVKEETPGQKKLKDLLDKDKPEEHEGE